MPSGIKINWSDFDQLIEQHLPNMTISEFTENHIPHISKKAVGSRARKLGIIPAKKKLSQSHKDMVSDHFTKEVNEDQKLFICSNLNKISRKDISKKIGVSLYIINKIIKNLDLEIDFEFQKTIHAEKSKEHVHLATEASVKMWDDEEFREKMSKKLSAKTSSLWQDEKYRSKVKNGIQNKYENSDLRERLSAIGKERYQNDESIKKILHADRPFKTSKLNSLVAQVLESHNIDFEIEFELANYKFDFKIGNILLEVQGDYWHNLPPNIKNDRAKLEITRKYYPNYSLRYIWESEFKSIRGKERLLEILGYKQPNPTSIDIQELSFEIYNDKKSAEKFVNSYHYLGWAKRCSKIFRLHFFNQTIILATFGQPVRPNTAPGRVLELIRLCRNPYFYNKNMGSYFLSRCEKSIKKLKEFDNLVSFSDNRLHNGTIYAASNWEYVGETQSDYQYLSSLNVPMHKKTLYNRAKSCGMKEREYAELHSYRKTIVGTKSKWLRKLA